MKLVSDGEVKLFFKDTDWILDERKRHYHLQQNTEEINVRDLFLIPFELSAIQFQFGFFWMNHFRWSCLICKCASELEYSTLLITTVFEEVCNSKHFWSYVCLLLEYCLVGAILLIWLHWHH